MTVTLVLPGPLRELAEGRTRLPVAASGETVGDAFAALRSARPGLYDRIVTERGEVRPHVNVFVGTADIRWSGGLGTPVREGDEVVILPAVSGG